MDLNPSDLKGDNDRLRQENEDLRRQMHQASGGGGGGPVIIKKSGNKGCTAAILVVAVGFGGIAFLAIVAAIALPMYSVFKQKSRVGVTLKQITELEQSLISWHQEHQGFDGLVLGADGVIRSQSDRLGILGPQEGRTWQFEADGDCLQIRFRYGLDAGCRSGNCDGFYEICNQDDTYQVNIEVGDGSLGMNSTYQAQ